MDLEMTDARKHPRFGCRLPVDVFAESEAGRCRCVIKDVSYNGLFAIGSGNLRPGDAVRLAIGPRDGDTLHLDARVARVTSSGVAFTFVGNSPATMEVLDALLNPYWDGVDLLQGVITAGTRYGSRDLAGWMRLTSLVSEWRQTKSPIPSRI
jgi:hypothetical protein